MTYELFIASTDAELDACFSAFQVLRPHLTQDAFVPQVRRQQAQSYQIVALRQDGVVKSAAGYRLAEFLAWGKVLYIDDLTTLEEHEARALRAPCWIGSFSMPRTTIARRFIWTLDTPGTRPIARICARVFS